MSTKEETKPVVNLKTAAGSTIIPPLLKANESNIPGGGAGVGSPSSISGAIGLRMKADEIATAKRNEAASKALRPAVAAPAPPSVTTVTEASKAAPTV